MALTHFANRGDKNDKGENKIEVVDEIKAKGSKGNLKVLTDFAQRGKVSQSGPPNMYYEGGQAITSAGKQLKKAIP
ncbi:hypothetical protein Pyn_32883 [Prunus yedoensis var. nudiflora]|uniref:Uncharacterized protein n=1 Tax=Prunus yedoensis var. nudiflora TaxID=2094558 RepID=A0A314UJ54_PRUYE|nr:hypothetical protein Pyn_32883 [Prunus yedoensis var. nudiflora]